ncbi:MAG TPA: hypothetical protein VMA76_00595 [Solirubrobacteraceae bacterium]|nr:hypothetical protein [Solirubrobacteraceae bacterium]
MTHETEAPPEPATATAEPAMATAEPPVAPKRQRLTKPSTPAAPVESSAAEATPTARVDDPDRKLSIVSQLMQDGADETQALLDAVGLRGDLSGEARDIARLIERRLAVIAAAQYDSPHAPAIDHLEIQRAFLEHRFVGPLKAYERTFRGYSVLDNFLNVTSILAGLGASLAAALGWPKVWVIVAGLIVGALQSLSQWLKPSRRSTRRGLAANALRSEGWAFLQNRDRYKGRESDPAGAWKVFCDQIDRVEEREQTAQDRELADGPSTKNAGKR